MIKQEQPEDLNGMWIDLVSWASKSGYQVMLLPDKDPEGRKSTFLGLPTRGIIAIYNAKSLSEKERIFILVKEMGKAASKLGKQNDYVYQAAEIKRQKGLMLSSKEWASLLQNHKKAITIACNLLYAVGLEKAVKEFIDEEASFV